MENAEKFLEENVARLVQENLDIGNEASKKRGRKINLGEKVVTLKENKENENVAGPLGLQRSKIIIWERRDGESEKEEVSIPRRPAVRQCEEKVDRKGFRKNGRKRALNI